MRLSRWSPLFGVWLCACGEAPRDTPAPVAQRTSALGEQRFEWVRRNVQPPSGGICASDSARDAYVCVLDGETLSHPLAPGREAEWERAGNAPALADVRTFPQLLVDFPPQARVLAFTDVAGLITPWQWDGRSWTPQFRASAPTSSQYWQAGAYDPVHQNVVVYGATQIGTAQYRGRTLLWDGDLWSQGADIPTLSCPALAFDHASSRMILTGLDETDRQRALSWDGTSWSALPAPPLDTCGELVVDPGMQTALFGATTVEGTTQLFNLVQSAWVARTLPAEANERNASMPFADSRRARVLFDRGRWAMSAQGYESLLPVRPSGGGWAAAYDEDTRELILIGSQAQRLQGLQHWRRSSASGTWSTHPPAPWSGARGYSSGAQLVYDTAAHRAVLFTPQIGANPTLIASTVSLYQDGAWSNGPSAPAPAHQASLAYDRSRGMAMLELRHLPKGMYRLDAGAWLYDGPASNQQTSSLGYDPVQQRLLATYTYGTDSLVGVASYANSAWSYGEVAANNPRYAAQQVFDPVQGQSWVLAGTRQTVGPTFSARAWNGSGWGQGIYGNGPRTVTFAAFDTQRGSVLAGDSTEGLWELRDLRWQQREPLLDPATLGPVACDPQTRRTLMLGYDRRTYEWDTSRWTVLDDTPTTVASDGDPGTLVRLPQTDGTTRVHRFYSSGVSRWTGSSWELISAQPGPRVVAYDPARGRVLALGSTSEPAADGGVHLTPHTMAWNGTGWDVLGPAPQPDPTRSIVRAGHVLITDEARGRVVLHGGYHQDDDPLNTGAPLYKDTWEWDGNDWTRLAADGVAPAPRWRPSATYAPGMGVLVMGGLDPNLSGVRSDLWQWNGSEWSFLLPAAPHAANGSYLACDAKGAMLFGIEDSTYAQFGLVAFGQTCAANDQCPSGFCTDGVCCVSSVCGTCETCNGVSPGSCSAVVGGEDPDTCPTNQRLACDARGRCTTGIGASCTSSADCGVGQCVDGVCCDSACSGTCESCRASDNTAGRDGICSPVQAGVDPRDDCPDDGAASCQRNGTCDGRRACAFYATQTCGAARCEGDQLVVPGKEPASCNGYRCVGNACLGTCSQLADCADGYVCSAAGQCTPPNQEQSVSSGCQCEVARASSVRSSAWLALGALLLRLRRRRPTGAS